jgi:hypothetical protein
LPQQEVLRFCPPAIKVENAEEEMAEQAKESSFIMTVEQIEEKERVDSNQIVKTIEILTKEESEPMIGKKIEEQQSFLTVISEPQIRYNHIL